MTAPRVVSLVPSLTEAVAVTAPGLLVGVTDWCTHPADLGGAARVGGTKNPDTTAIAALRPDLVLANEEENRAPDLAALRAAGIEVLVTEVRTLDQALRELARVLAACGVTGRPRWLDDAEAAWADVRPDGPPRRAVVPVWRRPWMVLGRDTFAGDLLARLGVANAYAAIPTATRASRSTSCGPPVPIWSSCPTSRTASPPATGPRRSPGCPPPSSTAATSPGTGRPSPRRPRCCAGRCEQRSADQPRTVPEAAASHPAASTANSATAAHRSASRPV